MKRLNPTRDIPVKEEEVNIEVTSDGNILRIKKEDDYGTYIMEEDVKEEETLEVKAEDVKAKEKQPHGVKQEEVKVKEEKRHFRIPKVEEDVLGVKEMEEAEEPTVPSSSKKHSATEALAQQTDESWTTCVRSDSDSDDEDLPLREDESDSDNINEDYRIQSPTVASK
ncbi:hypothetical protein UPYG_G00053560, partial [Umbra pygmaea]